MIVNSLHSSHRGLNAFEHPAIMAANIGQHGSLLDQEQGQMVDFRSILWQTPLSFAENRHDTNGPCEVEFSTGTNRPVVQKLLDHLTRDLVSAGNKSPCTHMPNPLNLPPTRFTSIPRIGTSFNTIWITCWIGPG